MPCAASMRSHRAGWAHSLYVLASLSHRWRLITLLFALPPLVDWKMLVPCQQCVAFEALATHAGPAAVTRSGVDQDQFLRAFNLSAFVPPGMKRRGQKRLPKKPEMLAQA